MLLPAGKPETLTLAVPLTTGTVTLPIVTLPPASAGKVTVTVAFSPSVTLGASIVIVAFSFGVSATSIVAVSTVTSLAKS